MAWDFETEPEFQAKLDWADAFVREEVEPLDLAFPHLQFTPLEGKRRDAVDPLKEEVRRQGLWATHLGPELGGQGFGQLKLALLNEILGRSSWAPIVFGWVAVGHQLGAGFAAFAGGLVRQQAGSYAPAFVMAGVAGVIAAVAVVMLARIGRDGAPALHPAA